MDQDSAKTSPAPPTEPQELDFHFIKSNFFRVIYVTGAHGGLGPDGNIQMAVFNDRQPIPTKQTVRLEGGQPLGEISREQRTGLVREVEASLVFSPSTAQAVCEFLNLALKKRAELEKQMRAESTPTKG